MQVITLIAQAGVIAYATQTFGLSLFTVSVRVGGIRTVILPQVATSVSEATQAVWEELTQKELTEHVSKQQAALIGQMMRGEHD